MVNVSCRILETMVIDSYHRYFLNFQCSERLAVQPVIFNMSKLMLRTQRKRDYYKWLIDRGDDYMNTLISTSDLIASDKPLSLLTCCLLIIPLSRLSGITGLQCGYCLIGSPSMMLSTNKYCRQSCSEEHTVLHPSSSPVYINRSIILSGLANFLRNRDLLRFFRATGPSL